MSVHTYSEGAATWKDAIEEVMIEPAEALTHSVLLKPVDGLSVMSNVFGGHNPGVCSVCR